MTSTLPRAKSDVYEDLLSLTDEVGFTLVPVEPGTFVGIPSASSPPA